MPVSSERTAKLLWFIVLAGLSGILGWIVFDRPGLQAHAPRDAPGDRASAVLADDVVQDELNFCRLPSGEVAHRPAGPPALKNAFNSLFKKIRSTLVDLEYFSSLVSTENASKELSSDLTDLTISISKDVFSPTRWAIVAIYLMESKPDRSLDMTEQELWQSYHLITERYEAALIEYDKIRDRVFASIGVDTPDTTNLRGSPLPGREWP